MMANTPMTKRAFPMQLTVCILQQHLEGTSASLPGQHSGFKCAAIENLPDTQRSILPQEGVQRCEGLLQGFPLRVMRLSICCSLRTERPKRHEPKRLCDTWRNFHLTRVEHQGSRTRPVQGHEKPTGLTTLTNGLNSTLNRAAATRPCRISHKETVAKDACNCRATAP